MHGLGWLYLLGMPPPGYLPDSATLNPQSTCHGPRPGHTLTPIAHAGLLRAPQPRAREKTRGRKNKKCRCPNKSHIIHSNMYSRKATKWAQTPPDARKGAYHALGCLGEENRITKTCLPINNYVEYRKSLLNLISATANRRKCLEKRKSLRRIPKGAILFFSTGE